MKDIGIRAYLIKIDIIFVKESLFYTGKSALGTSLVQ